MMQCELCRDTNGPFEIADIGNRVRLVCEDCAKKNKAKNEKMVLLAPKIKGKKYRTK